MGLVLLCLFQNSSGQVEDNFECILLTQLCVFVAWDLLGLPKVNPFYAFTGVHFPFNLLGYVFGVGLTEEFGKMIPLLIILRNAKEPLIPQTMVFYGLMAGISFGVLKEFNIR